MGKELCKPCDNYLKGEEKNLSKSQQIKKNQNDTDGISQSSRFLISLAKKKQSKIIKKKGNRNNNNEKLKSSFVLSNSKKIDSNKVVVDENEIKKIIYNYHINLLISSFKKCSSNNKTEK